MNPYRTREGGCDPMPRFIPEEGMRPTPKWFVCPGCGARNWSPLLDACRNCKLSGDELIARGYVRSEQPNNDALRAEMERVKAAWERYQRRDISQEEFEGTIADLVEGRK
jgi:hypothetical protein